MGTSNFFASRGLTTVAARTYPGTYSIAAVSNFIALQVGNRDSASWKKATHIIVDPPSSSASHNDVVKGFVKIAKKDPQEDFLQVLYYTEDGVLYDLYDAEGYKIGDGDLKSMYSLAEDFLRCRSRCNFVQRQFYNWLIQQPASSGAGGTFAQGMVRRYCDCLRSYLGDALFSSVGVRNVFEVVDGDDFQLLNAATGPIRSVAGFAAFDKNHFNGAFSAALNRYEEFLRTPEGKRLQVMNKNIYQRISYGAPGTGKSFGIAEKIPDEDVFRTTFHPDSDYATFVGAYKPTMKKVPRVVVAGETIKKATFDSGITASEKAKLEIEEKISYEFRPQAFMQAYVAAWKEMAKGSAGKPVVLVIEEINRGNCAQIFGDLFQLLDRDDNGWSTYPIDADTDLAKWLASDETDENQQLVGFGSAGLGMAKPADATFKMKQSDWDAVMKGKKLVLPPNLYIWATMNTSDQSLFPIDSAFKRRWDWKYVPIREGKYRDGPKKGQKMGWKIRFSVPQPPQNGKPVPDKVYNYDWWEFLKNINAKIFKTTESEDKKLGYFFVKPDGEDAQTHDGTISADRFVGKVIFYLWNDVFKDYGIETIFKADDAKKSEDAAKGVEFQSFFNEDGDEANVDMLLKFFKHIGLESDEETAAAQPAQQQTQSAPTADQQAQTGNQ